MEINPKKNGGVYVCSRKNCNMFNSSVESGWGIAEKCFSWDETKLGKKPLFFDDMTVCKPYLQSIGFK